MNKQIIKLAEQAGSTHKQNLGVYQFYTDELEKFTKSVVEECAEVLSRVPGGTDSTLYYNHSRALKKHFGVDE